jgi:hypothetical protein
MEIRKAIIFFVILGPWAFKSHAGIFASAGLNTAYGEISSTNQTAIAPRNLMKYGADLSLGFKFSVLLLGGGLEYNFWRQLDEPSDVGGSNTQGKEINYSFNIGIDAKFFRVLGKYYLGSEYTMQEPSAEGAEIKYLEPEASYGLQVQVPMGRFSFIGFTYSKISFEKLSQAGTEMTLGEGSRLEATSLGLILGLSI